LLNSEGERGISGKPMIQILPNVVKYHVQFAESRKVERNMHFHFVPVEDVLDESILQEYKQKIELFYLEHLVPLNTNIYILEKLLHFPFELFIDAHRSIFFPIIYQNTYQISLLIVSRLANDQDGDFLTLVQFKNWLTKNIRTAYQENFNAWIKKTRFDNETKKLLKRTQELRHSYIAHIKRVPSISTEENLNLGELKNLRDTLNRLLDALSFNTDRIMLPIPYAFSDGENTDIDDILDSVAKESPLLNAPEQDPLYWESLKSAASPLSEADVRVINLYRRKFGLPDA
jgi:hypothetical protein